MMSAECFFVAKVVIVDIWGHDGTMLDGLGALLGRFGRVDADGRSFDVVGRLSVFLGAVWERQVVIIDICNFAGGLE